MKLTRLSTLYDENLIQRTITILIGLPIVLAIIIAGRPFDVLLALGVGIICGIELHNMIRAAHLFGLAVILILIGGLIVGLAYSFPGGVLATLGLVVGGSGAHTLYGDQNPRWGFWRTNYLPAIAGGVWIGLPLGLVLVIRHHNEGLAWIMLFFASNWSTDVFALLGGKLFGRHKLAPRISPSKTIEGTISGLSIGFLAALLVGTIFALSLGVSLLAGIVIPILTTVGDLLESKVKRFFGVKDTSALLPGHGGFLDRIDGLLLAAPGFWVLLTLFV